MVLSNIDFNRNLNHDSMDDFNEWDLIRSNWFMYDSLNSNENANAYSKVLSKCFADVFVPKY